MRTLLAMTAALLLQGYTQAQTLFTYGKHTVSSDEFIRAFRKNTEPGTITDASVRKYLDLYIRFKLKVQDAYALHLDTVVNKQEDVATFRKQIEDQYMFDPALMARLVAEAKERGKKEIRLSHIFIPFKAEFAQNPGSTLIINSEDKEVARQKAEKAYAQLLAGENFIKVARVFSADSSVQMNGGDLGFITVFTLPYPLESVAYSLPLNGFSKPFASDKGFHILLKTAERATSGMMQVQQILISFDREAGTPARQNAARLTDSLYTLLHAGASFDDLARAYSYDMVSAPGGGVLPPLTVGNYDPAFEEKVFALTKDGQISTPFETALGFHLVRRMRQIPPDSSGFGTMSWEQAILQDRRGKLPQIAFEQEAIQTVGLKSLVKDLPEFFRYSDSTIQGFQAYSPVFNQKTVLVQVNESSYNMVDWIGFAQSRVVNRTQEGYQQLWDDFKRAVAADYYRRNMEKYNIAYRNQIKEFTEGNLLFEIMERKIWSQASMDTTALKKYYSANKLKYQWGKSADVIIFSGSDSAVAATTRLEVMANPSRWRTLVEISGGRIVGDSARMDWKLVQPENAVMMNNTATPVVVNGLDKTASFNYIVKTYPKPSQKSFAEAKMQVINDYQVVLEERWINVLKSQYPIKVDEKEFTRVRNILMH